MAAPISAKVTTSANWLVDHPVAADPGPMDMAELATAPDPVLGAELAGAQASLGVSAEEILLAALGRAIARTIGEGTLQVDVAGAWAATPRPTSVRCAAYRYLTPGELLQCCGSDAQLDDPMPARVLLSGRPTGAHSESGGHLLELHTYPDTRTSELLHLEWRYDARSFEHGTIEELSEQFPLALIELASG